MPRFRDELKAELGRNAPRNAARPFRIRKSPVAVVLVVVVIGVGAYYASFPREPSGDKVLTYCGAEGIVMHYHARLVIKYNGVQEHLPHDPPGESGYIGFLPQDTSSAYQCPSGGFHALHTHDGSGIIHCELPWGDVTPNLGEFFTIWGQPLSSGGAWIYSGSVSAKVVDMDAHTTTDYSSNPAIIPFDHPAGGPYSNPYSIPQNLIFYGQYGTAEVKQPVVVAGRLANKHVIQHLLRRPRRTAVPDEVGPEFIRRGLSERHVVSQDLDLLPVHGDRRERVVRRARFDRLIQLDIRRLRAADDPLLFLRRQGIPPSEVVEVLLHDYVAPAGEVAILLADESRVRHRLTDGILGPVNETKEIPTVEVTEAVHFVHRRNGISESGHDLRRQFEAEILPLRPDMEQHVSRCRNGQTRPGSNFAEDVQLGRPRLTEEPPPNVGSKRHDTREVSRSVAKSNGAQERSEVSAERSDNRLVTDARVNLRNEEDRGAGQRRGDRLWNGLRKTGGG